MKLPVVVRRMRASKELIALFVTRPATDDPAMCWGYTMNLSLTAVDPNHVIRATDKVETGEAQGFVARHILPPHHTEMGLALPVTWEIQQRDRREENFQTRNKQLKEQGNG